MTTPIENADMEKHGVRFAIHDDKIEPERDLHAVETITGLSNEKHEDLNPEAEQELKQLRSTLQNNTQISRAQHHAFEPVSLPGSQPASRIPSGSNTPNKRHFPAGSNATSAVQSAMPSPRPSPPQSVHSPPLTPAATRSLDGKAQSPVVSGLRPGSDTMTPERSASPQRDDKPSGETAVPIQATAAHPKQTPTFSIGPADSQPTSADVSPSSTAPGTPQGGGPKSDSTVRHSRASESVNSRFRFGDRDPAVGYTNSGQASAQVPNINQTPRSSGTSLSEKRASFFGGKKHNDDTSSTTVDEKSSGGGSKSNLKRFFKFGEKFGDHKHKEKDRHTWNGGARDGTQTPPQQPQQQQQHQFQSPSVPFADDHGIASKYGKFGKVLGSGAGGSVRLMKRTGDGTVFAVKQFRDRHSYESEKEYNKKVTAEFCIGSTLHHGNIIETIDIVFEKSKWYEVMEYAPFDLFATVMTGKMGREEVSCATLQILSGVLYLHSMGLAHRDLKLDNVVISEHGIMKLIDFGSAVVFRYPFENDVVLATGVVGSDPYLAPEVYDHSRYDPRPADIWSIAIIFCCMTLRRFPWKAPRMSDNSYRLFVSAPDPDQDKVIEAHRRTLTGSSQRSIIEEDRKKGAQSEPASRNNSREEGKEHKHHRHQHKEQDQPANKSEPVSRQTTADAGAQPTIKGPLRLLRLLPRETRHIIGRMLELDPSKRATMDEVLADPWVQNSLVCRQEENGVIIKAPNHSHTLQPSGGGGSK